MSNYPTDEDVCNLALGLIGEWYITSIYNDSQVERLCRLHLPQIRRTLLRMHAWNFAIDRKELELSTLENTFGYEYRHALPADYLQALTVWADSERTSRIDVFKIEGQAIVSDYEEVYLEYVADVSCSHMWSTDFIECVTHKLGIALCKPLGVSMQLSSQLYQKLEESIIPRSLTNNSWEDQSAENNPLEQQLADSNYLKAHNVSY